MEVLHWTIFWDSWNEPLSSDTVSPRSTIIISFHLRLCFQITFSFDFFQSTYCKLITHSSYVIKLCNSCLTSFVWHEQKEQTVKPSTQLVFMYYIWTNTTCVGL
jgi:hypothetical protein